MFEGLSVAMVTPFRHGEIDWPAVDRLVDHLISEGVQGLLPAGTTGEGATLGDEERRELVRRVVRRARGRAWVAPGTGTNDTAVTIERTRQAHEDGADGALVVTPYYNKPTQEGLYQHFAAVASAVPLPIIVYIVPSRTSVNLTPATLVRLAPLPNIVAVKEASGSLDQVSEICRDTSLTVLSGDDSLTLPILSVGGRGVVSVLGQLTPRRSRLMIDSFFEGRLDEARALHLELLALTKALFLETNPAPVKRALASEGWITNELRLPMVPMSESSGAVLDRELAAERRRPLAPEEAR